MSVPDNSSQLNDESADRVFGNNLPDWKIYGYQAYKRLSTRSDLGRFSYLGAENESGRSVVIKEWRQFDPSNPSLDYDNFLPEIERWIQLEHPNIPQYLNSFATPTGFCVVREYVDGVSLAEIGELPPGDIKLVGDTLLKVLNDLHHLQPSLIHHNIKPENIIANTAGELAIYLVDFGLPPAQTGDATAKVREFLPPEQLFVLDRSPKSDLHSLGVSLVCLLTGTSSSQTEHLFDENYHLQFEHLAPENTDPYLIAWLQTMVEQNRDRRSINVSSHRYRLANSIFSEQAYVTSLARHKRKQKIRWWLWSLPILGLLGLGWFLRPWAFPDSDELTPAQIAKNQELAKKAEFAASARGRLLNEKECGNCNFNGQNFAKAELTGANVPKSTFNGTNLEGANLKLAIFRDADLSGANLTRANLQRAAFFGTKFVNTNLNNADLSNAKLVYAKLKNSTLQNVNLSNADLQFAELIQVDLTNANLTGADLRNADLSNSNLLGAKLAGAKLNGAKLTGATMPDGSVSP